MMTEEDVKRIISERLDAPDTRLMRPEIVQWLVRFSFETAWRAAGGDPVDSPHDQEPVGWRAAWLKSEPRAILVRNGVISGQDGYR